MYNILRHGTLEILQPCHLGICMYTMETRKGLTEYPYTLHIEEVYHPTYVLIVKALRPVPPIRFAFAVASIMSRLLGLNI